MLALGGLTYVEVHRKGRKKHQPTSNFAYEVLQASFKNRQKTFKETFGTLNKMRC